MLEVLYASKNIIHVVIIVDFCEKPCFCSFVYGPPRTQDRGGFWSKLGSLTPGDDDLWLCLGDFNEILCQSEKQGGAIRSSSSFTGFQSWVFGCGMIDLEFKGPKFTWNNGQVSGDHIKERLDRAVCNLNFRRAFPRLIAANTEMMISDHCLLLVDFFHRSSSFRRSFKFENFWVDHIDYPTVVCNGWSEELCGDWRNPVPRTFERLRKCGRVLWDWSRKAFPNNAKLLASLKHRLPLLRKCC